MEQTQKEGSSTRRLDVQFASQGPRCSAWLYLPDGLRAAPVVVMAHGLGGTRIMRLDAFAERFCGAGYACLVFDYRHFGDSEGEPRQLLDVAKQLAAWKAAVAFARACPDVDGERIVLWGTSFGGGHVLAIAADNPHLAAVISQCPFTDGLASTFALSTCSSLKVTGRALRDQITSWTGGAPVMVATAGPPWSAALMTAPDALPGYRELQPADSHAPNEVAARFALQLIRYRPGRRTARIACPALFCVCESDSVAPAKTTLRHARRAPKGEIKLYAEGHFDIYVGAAFERVVRDQIDFLRRVVPLD